MNIKEREQLRECAITRIVQKNENCEMSTDDQEIDFYIRNTYPELIDGMNELESYEYCLAITYKVVDILTEEEDEIVEEEDENRFNYQMLDRLKSDCEYYLNCGNRCKKHLYYDDEQKHIDEMKKLYNSFSEDKKPEWLTWEQILTYEKQMVEGIKE